MSTVRTLNLWMLATPSEILRTGKDETSAEFNRKLQHIANQNF